MDTEKLFKTKTGYCHILQDKIILTRDGVVGNLAKVTAGNNITRILVIYGLISIGLFCFASQAFREDKAGPALFLFILGIFLIISIFKSLNNSATPVIGRDKIKSIEFKKAIPSVTRAYFIVHFENEKGQIKQRLIMLPGSLTGGPIETEKALRIMTEEFGQIKNAS